MKGMSSGVRYRPYRRSISIHRTSPEVIDCEEDDLDDTIVVLYDGVRLQAAAAAAAPVAAAATGKAASAAAPAAAAAAASAATGLAATAAAGTPGATDAPQKADSSAAGGAASKSSLDFSPWRVSRIPLPHDLTPDLSNTLCASPTDAAAGAKATQAGYLTIDEVFSPFAASPKVMTETGTETVKKRPKGNRFLMTSTPAVPESRPMTSTPAVRGRASGSDVQDVTPFIITLDEDPSVLEVTEVRRVFRHRTPATVKKSAAAKKKTPVAAKKSAAAAADLSSSMEDGELTRSRHNPGQSYLSLSTDRSVVCVRPLRRTSSTQRRLQAVVRAARNTLTRQTPTRRTPTRRTPTRRTSTKRTPTKLRGRKMKGAEQARGRKTKRAAEPVHWKVDRRGSRFAAPLGASDQPIQFAPDFSESFARMVDERPKRPIIIDGPNVAYAHGRDQACSIRGIKITLDYFKDLGHRCTVFLPSNFINRARTEENVKLLDEIYRSGDLAYTPSRRIRGRLVTSYDDRYVVMYATAWGGVILSRDLYRDVAEERPDWKDTIDNRLLIPVFVGDQLLLPPDPLGRDGPGLLEFLTFPAGTSLLPDEKETRPDDRDGHDRRGDQGDPDDRNDRDGRDGRHGRHGRRDDRDTGDVRHVHRAD